MCVGVMLTGGLYVCWCHVNWRSLCVLVSCCCELRSLSLKFITI